MGRRNYSKTYRVGKKKYEIGSKEAEKARRKADLTTRYLEVISHQFMKADMPPDLAAQIVLEELIEVDYICRFICSLASFLLSL